MQFVSGNTVSQIFLNRIKTTPHVVGFTYKPATEWKEVTFRSFYDQCRPISFGLMNAGVIPGDRVCILSNTRFEWSLCDMAILGARGVTVPIYPSSPAADVVYILNHAECKVAIVEDLNQLKKVSRDHAQGKLPYLKKIVVIDSSGIPELPAGAVSLQTLRETGEREEARDPLRFDQNLTAALPDELITICYTSGTTGTPKGAMLTHDNMASVLEDCIALLANYSNSENQTILTFLPFSHILGKVESMTVWPFGWKQAFAENLDKLMTNMSEVRPTVMFAVPRIFEKAYSRIHSTIDGSFFVRKRLFRWAVKAGRAYYGALWQKKLPSPKVIAEYMTARRLVFRKISDRFGGSLRFVICGGAPLPREIGEFFQIAGIRILEGYGLTETCAPVAVNTPEDTRFGVVGKPLPEVTIKIAEDGEILVKSRKVFKGYYKMPEETAEVIQNGWFHTGDIGVIDDDGFLKITDRKKDIIITSGGKNVAPQKIEGRVKQQGSMISQIVVQGDRRPYLTAFVTLDREQVIRHANEHHILFSEYSELVKNPKVISLVQRVIDEVNKGLASFETIKKFIILATEFTIERGELTPSLKVKRKAIGQKFQAELESLYESSSGIEEPSD